MYPEILLITLVSEITQFSDMQSLLQALPSQIKLDQTFAFLLFYFLGGGSWIHHCTFRSSF